MGEEFPGRVLMNDFSEQCTHRNLNDVSLLYYNAYVSEDVFPRLLDGLTGREECIVEGILRVCGLCDEVWRTFTVVSDNTWVWVKGGIGDYGCVVTVSDGTTSVWVRIPYEAFDVMARRMASNLSRVATLMHAIASRTLNTVEPC